MSHSGIFKALELTKNLPTVSLFNLKPLLPLKKHQKKVGLVNGTPCGRSRRGKRQFNTLPPFGITGERKPPYMKIPMEPYYKDRHLRREYPPLSLFQLQRMIDLARVDTSKPIDLTSLCNTRAYFIKNDCEHYGVNLADEGADIFTGKVNIEVQWASEVAIAAIERNGGVITTRFYNKECVEAMSDPENFFKRGMVIPRCKFPPKDAIAYYSDPKNRGYLADPQKVAEERMALAQKYGYKLIDLTKDPDYEMFMRKKDPRQIWYGLQPGWVVNLMDKCILKPTDENLIEYYKS